MTGQPMTGHSMTGQASARRCRALLAGALLWPWATGCYTYHQVAGPAVAPGSDVTLSITDRGRVALGDSLGPGLTRLSGRVSQRTDSALVLHISSVEYLNGQLNRWNGERFTVGRDLVGSVSEKRFSRTRTWLAVGATVGGVALLAGLVALVVSGIDDGDGTRQPGGGTGTQ